MATQEEEEEAPGGDDSWGMDGGEDDEAAAGGEQVDGNVEEAGNDGGSGAGGAADGAANGTTDEEKAEAAAKIQAIHRGNAERKDLAEKSDAAAKIQAIQRGKAARAEVEIMKASGEGDWNQQQGGDGYGEEEAQQAPASMDMSSMEPPPDVTHEEYADQDYPVGVASNKYEAANLQRATPAQRPKKFSPVQRHLQAPSKELHKKSCLRRMRLPSFIPSTPTIVMIGDLETIESEAQKAMLKFFTDGVMRAAGAVDALVVDSGLSTGLCTAHPDCEFLKFCSGVTTLGISPGGIDDELSQFHSHQLVLSDFAGWGDRQAEFIKHKFAMIRRLAGTCRVVAVLVNNGHTAWGEAIECVRLGIPLIVVQGSGDLANEIVFAKMTGQCYDFNIREVVNSGCIVIFNSECNAADLAALLRLHVTIDVLAIQRASAARD